MTEVARRRARMPEGAGAILDTRSLASSPRLAALLTPGDRVLDVGCGTGAITRGIADAVGPRGRAVGLDVERALIAEAGRRLAGVTALSFVRGDVLALPFRDAFDVVTAARVLQWLADPLGALRSMVGATRPGGRVVVLDYNHEKIHWTPAPPASARRFYAVFCRWRSEAGMDNAIADRLAGLLAAAGLGDVTVTPAHETTLRGDPDFDTRIGIWAAVAVSRGRQMVEDGAVTERERAAAEAEYGAWAREAAESQTMYLLAADGVRRVST